MPVVKIQDILDNLISLNSKLDIIMQHLDIDVVTPVDPMDDVEVKAIVDKFDEWETHFGPALFDWAANSKNNVRQLYELEYVYLGYVSIYEVTNNKRYLENALILMRASIASAPWFRAAPNNDRWLLEEIKATRIWSKVCYFAQLEGIDVQDVKDFLHNDILGFWLNNPLWGWSTGEDWMRGIHKSTANAVGHGHWSNHQTMCAILCRYMGKMGYTRWEELADYLLQEFLDRKDVVNGAWLWDKDKLREGDIDSWHSNRVAWWLVDEGVDVTELITTFNDNVYYGDDLSGWPEFNEYIDGTNDCDQCPPASVQIYGGWVHLGEFDDEALDVCMSVWNRIVNGPYNGLLYYLNAHPTIGHRQMCLAGTLAVTLARRIRNGNGN